MYEQLDLFRMSTAMARHAAARQAVIATNLANADTPATARRSCPISARPGRKAAAEACGRHAPAISGPKGACRHGFRPAPPNPRPTGTRSRSKPKCSPRSMHSVNMAGACHPAPRHRSFAHEPREIAMADLNDALRAAASGMQAQAQRIRLVSENIANAGHPRLSSQAHELRGRDGAAAHRAPSRPGR